MNNILFGHEVVHICLHVIFYCPSPLVSFIAPVINMTYLLIKTIQVLFGSHV